MARTSPRLTLERLEPRVTPVVFTAIDGAFAAATELTATRDGSAESDRQHGSLPPSFFAFNSSRELADSRANSDAAFATFGTGTTDPVGLYPAPTIASQQFDVLPFATFAPDRQAEVRVDAGTVSAEGSRDFGAPLTVRIDPGPRESVGQRVRLILSGGLRVENQRVGEAAGIAGETSFLAEASFAGETRSLVDRTETAQDLLSARVEDSTEFVRLDARIGDTVQITGKVNLNWSFDGSDIEPFRVESRLFVGIAQEALPDLAIAPFVDGARNNEFRWNEDRQATAALFDRRGVDYEYQVQGQPLPSAARLALFWGRGPNAADKIAEIAASSKPTRSAVGAEPFQNDPARYGRPPAGATHLLLILDPDNRVAEADESNNVAALPLHTPQQILEGSFVGRVVNEPRAGPGRAISAVFAPGDGAGLLLTLSEAEVVLGVDHFNVYQEYTSPAHISYSFGAPGLIGPPVPIPGPNLVDPPPQITNQNQLLISSTLAGRTVRFGALAHDQLEFYYDDGITAAGNGQYEGPFGVFGKMSATTLGFYDAPQSPSDFFAPGEFDAFRTRIVGVATDNRRVELPVAAGFTWRSNTVYDAAANYSGGITIGRAADENGVRFRGSAGGVFDVLPFDVLAGSPLPAFPSSPRLPLDRFVVGPGSGGETRVFDAAGNAVRGTPFEAGGGGVRVALADVNGDGSPDTIAAAGPGGPPLVVVTDGVTGEVISRFLAFEESFRGGLFVAAGDLNLDGRAEVVVSPDRGGGPRVRVLGVAGDGTTVGLADFFGIDDPNFRGGARAALGDISGDGLRDLLVAAGVGGGPRVAVFDGESFLTNGGRPTSGPLPKLIDDFFVFESSLRNGAFVAAGDLDGDGFAEVIAGGGPGGGPRVLALSGVGLLRGERELRGNFFAGDAASRGGVRVGARELTGDGRAELIVGAGEGAGSAVTVFTDIPADGAPNAFASFNAFPGLGAGVFVG